MRGMSPPPREAGQRAPSLAWVAAFLLLGLFAPLGLVPGAAALQANVQATQASGSGWSNPSFALSSDANYASASADDATLVLGSFVTTGLSGSVTSVTLHLDQSQPNHLDDRFLVRQNDPSGCGASSSTADAAATTGRSTLSFSLSCPSGWTWARVQVLQVTVESMAVLLVDGDFRVHHAYLQVTYTNAKPVANAGPDRSVAEATSVTLDGRSSSDPDGDALSYHWTQTAGPNVQLASAATSMATFQAPTLSSGQQATLDFQLRVTDTAGNTATDSVRVTVMNANLAPLADAGPDQQAEGGAVVTLDGSRSRDPDSDAITHQWTQTFGPSVELSDRAAAKPTFRAPLFGATLEFGLVVTDNHGARSDPDLVVVFVAGSTQSPTDPTGEDTNGSVEEPPPGAGLPAAIRIDPPRVLVAPGEGVAVRVLGYDAEGRRVALLDCAWNDARSGGRVEIGGSCAGTFRAGDRLGLHYELVATVSTGSGMLSAGAPVVVAAVASAEGAPSAPGEPRRCSAVVDPRTGSREMPVGFAAGCALEMVVLEWRARPEEPVRLTAAPVSEWPADVPQPPGRRVPGRVLEIHLEEEDGGSVRAERATIRFTVPRTWLATECPPATCMVRLFHWRDGAWESLAAERVGETDSEIAYSAQTESFSLFVPGGVPIGKDPARGGGFSWGSVVAWLGLIGSAALLGLFLVRHLGRRRAHASPAADALPPPPARSKAVKANGKVAPADLVALVKGVVDKYAPRATAADVRLDVVAAGSLPVVVERAKVAQVATLLLDLAANTAQAEGAVEVRLRDRNGYAVVEFEEEPGKPWSADVVRPVPPVDLSPAAAAIEAQGGRVWVKNGRNHVWGFMLPLRTAESAFSENEPR